MNVGRQSTSMGPVPYRVICDIEAPTSDEALQALWQPERRRGYAIAMRIQNLDQRATLTKAAVLAILIAALALWLAHGI